MGRGHARQRSVTAAIALAAMAAALPALARGEAPRKAPPPNPEPNFAVSLMPRPCAYEGHDPYERRIYRTEGWKGPNYVRYPGACERLRFAFGPLSIKPGQNDVLIHPLTTEKPDRDGYITRFAPNLVLPDGTVPPVEQIHLHHGTWLSYPEYGHGPFFASGEEKTVAPFPRGFGMPVKATDNWELLYMVHSAVPKPMVVYITYDVDFIPTDKAKAIGLKPAYPIWLDVRPSGYPVFNVQRPFGHRGTCTWPAQECAAFDPWGKQIVGQGRPGNGRGTDYRLPASGQPLGRIPHFKGGTLIGIGGHLHPGGIEDEVNLVRGGRSARIYTGRALYWNWKNPAKAGGPPTSWDYSMRVEGEPYWGVHVRPGDTLRINAKYDTTYQSTYENMGIVVALLAPDAGGKPVARTLDPFKARRDRSVGCRSRGLLAVRRVRAHHRHARRTRLVPSPRLCTRGGFVTHGHYAENGNHSGPAGKWSARTGAPTSNVTIANFLYAPGDLSTAQSAGIPTVKLGTDLRFTNLDGSAVYHTITTCAFPCLGPTGAAFPIADGSTSAARRVDEDSGELGFGAPAIGPAKETPTWDLPVTSKNGYKPGEVVTFYCRIHPFMRGAFKVTQ